MNRAIVHHLIIMVLPAAVCSALILIGVPGAEAIPWALAAFFLCIYVEESIFEDDDDEVQAHV